MNSLNLDLATTGSSPLGSAGSSTSTIKNQIANSVADMVRQLVLGVLNSAS